MSKLKLTNGQYTLIDRDVFVLAKNYKWRLNTQGYVRRSLSNGEFLHRLVMEAPEGKLVDHINRNPLDNRRSNLRLCDPSQNNINMKRRVDNRSGHRGIYWHKKANKWCAEISFRGKRNYLGLFEKLSNAVKIRKEKEKELYGQFANEA